MESHGYLFRYCISRPNCPTVVDGPNIGATYICRTLERRQRKRLHSYIRYTGEQLTHILQAVSFHPNSLYLGTASSDCTARLWDVQRGACVRVFYRHDDIVSTLAFSPDGRYLATAGTSAGMNKFRH